MIKALIYISTLAIILILVIAINPFRKYTDRIYADTRKLGPKPNTGQSLDWLNSQSQWKLDKLQLDNGITLYGVVHVPQNNDPNTPWLLYFHGNGKLDLASMPGIYQQLAGDQDWGFAVWGYRGFGLSEGVSTKTTMRDDSVIMAKRLMQQWHVSHQQIRIYGFSLGTAPATHAAMVLSVEGQAPAGVVLMATGYRPGLPGSLLYDPGSEVSRRDRITCPILITHGTKDHIHPLKAAISDYLALQSANAELLLVPGGHDHLNAPHVRQIIHDFLADPNS